MTIALGPISFHVYGFILGLAIVVGVEIAERFARREKIELAVWKLLPWVLGLGVIGARLYHVIDLWDFYKTQPGLIPAIWTGGIGIYGGIAGGLVGAFVYGKRAGIKYWTILDVLAVGAPLGQAIGRLGNWVNQELYGLPTNLPWGIPIDPEHRLPGFEAHQRFHPLFLYESLWSSLTFLVLFWVFRKLRVKVGSGLYFLAYIELYSTARFFLEYLRINPWRLEALGLTVAQLWGIGIWLLGIVAFSVVRLISNGKEIK